MNIRIPLLICTIFLFNYVQSSKILTIFNLPTKSHNILGVKLAEGLIKRGHHVTMVSPFLSDPMENYTEIQLKSILEHQSKKQSSGPSSNGFSTFFNIMKSCMKINELFWEEPSVQKIIEEKPHYDIVIIVSFFNDALLGIAHHLGAPVIYFSPIGSSSTSNRYFANPNMPYIPDSMISMGTKTLFGRAFAVAANSFRSIATDLVMTPFQEAILKKYLPNAPPLQELRNNISLMLMNSHFSIEPTRPYVPNMIQIGGFHIQDTKELPPNIKAFLDEAKHGAILFSMGSKVSISSFDKEKREAIFKVLGEMAPMKVVFKSEMEHENVPKNILVTKWLPQSDILAHPNTKVFISHGGLGGNTEAVYHGVPILGIPFVGDQLLNLAEAQSAGYAVVVQFKDITEELFRSKLKEVTENSKYRTNAKKRSALIKEQPVKPMDNAVFWIEHIIKFGGGAHLRNAGMDLTWYQLYMVDIYVFYTVLLLLLLIVNYYVTKLLLKLVTRLFSKTDSKIKTS